MPDPKPIRTVVITGASTGIGRDCALYMARLGWRVFAGVRDEADAASLRAEGAGQLTPVFLDVTDAASIAEARRIVAADVGEAGLSGLVNNAGIPYGGPVEFLSLEEVRREYDVNFFGVIAVTQAFLSLLRRGRGRIVNMSSVGGMVSAPFVAPYSSTKFALEALSDSLRMELAPWQMHVSVIQPGSIDTPIWNKAGSVVNDLIEGAPQEGLDLYGKALEGMAPRYAPHGIPTEHVSRAVADALTSARPRTRYAIGLDGAVARLLRCLPDRLRDRLILSQLPRWG
jgi:NAD(P)-dependent dehydrogenase (short-subunit alcohol dehydrogenase family)